MLRQRILTALVLLIIVGATLIANSPWPFLILICIIAGCALWEWLSLLLESIGLRRIVPVLAALSMVCLSGLMIHDSGQTAVWRQAFDRGLLPLMVVFWVLPATVMVLRGKLMAPFGPRALSVVAVLALFAVWYALAVFYLKFGAGCLLSMLILIWCADIAAYFTGRAWGRHKLAPQVSPGKTWEGAAGGVVAATVWLLASAWWWPGSFGALLLDKWSITGTVAAGIVLAALSIIGDLFESLLKRRAGVKDSGKLLPGHGGVYDRIDAVLPVAPLALLVVFGG